MDPSLYKTETTARGFKYYVYYSEATDASKPILLFLHGFPASSYDWRYQVAFFKQQGHAVVVPDMLGYGGTDKPLDAAAYAGGLIAKDVVDILDALNIVGPVVAVGHDWGSKIVSRLANLYADRFAGFVFYAVGYSAPNPSIGYAQFLAYTAKLAGHELVGYWSFFSEEDAPTVIEKHYDSFWDAIFSLEPEYVKTTFAPTGRFKAWLPEDKSIPLPSYLPEEEAKITKENFRKTGIAAPLSWYKVVTGSVDREDYRDIPQENYSIRQPVFFGGATKDIIAPPALFGQAMAKLCQNLTIKEYDAGHWVIWEAKDSVNEDLAAWIATL